MKLCNNVRFKKKYKSQPLYISIADLEVPKVIVTEEGTSDTSANTIADTTDLTDEDLDNKAQKVEREAFFRKLMEKKKPLLQRQKSNPTPLDITKEESIAKYIAEEVNTDTE